MSTAKPVSKPEAPTALHRENPFGPTGGAIYFNSITDRWYAQARILDDAGQPRRKTTVARTRDDALDALVAIRAANTLANGETPAPAKPTAKPRRRGRDADLEFVPGVGTVLPARKTRAKAAK